MRPPRALAPEFVSAAVAPPQALPSSRSRPATGVDARVEGGARGTWNDWRNAVVFGVAIALLARAASLGIMLRHLYGLGFVSRLLHAPGATLQPLYVWDGGWIDEIANSGYGPYQHVVTPNGVQNGLAFPPLLPGLMAALHVIGIPTTVAGIVLGVLGLVALCVGLFRLVEMDFGRTVAGVTLVVLLASPTAFFLGGIAYEDVFALGGVVWAFLALRWGRPWLAGVFLAVATLSKLIALVAIVALVVEHLHVTGRQWRRPGLDWLRMAAAPVAAIAGWCVWAGVAYGSPLAMVTSQSGWERQLAPPWVAFRAALTELWDKRFIGQQAGPVFVLDVVGALLLAAGAVYIWRTGGRAAYAVLCGVLALALTSSSVLRSVDRHMLMAFPIFIALAVVIEKRRWLIIPVLLVFVPLQVDMMNRFVNQLWAG